MELWVWLGLFVILIVIELLTTALTTIWFAAGALLAFISNLLFDNVVIDICVFAISSVLFFLLLRPWMIKYFNKRRKKTNLDALIGQQVILTESIDRNTGLGKATLNGMDWTVKSSDVILAGDTAEVVSLEGVKLIIKEKEN